jgi:winged helix DNA-binding protein
VDGFVAARWKLDAGTRADVLRIEPLRRLSSAERSSVDGEARGLLAFLGATNGRIRHSPAA